jgi:hypothetical protein
VFSGMIGVTLFGIFLTPVFFSVIMRFFGERKEKAELPERLAVDEPARR